MPGGKGRLTLSWWAGIPIILLLVLSNLFGPSGIGIVYTTIGLTLAALIIYLFAALLAWLMSLLFGRRQLVLNVTFCAITSLFTLAHIVGNHLPLTEAMEERAALRRVSQTIRRSSKEAGDALKNPSLSFLQQNRILADSSMRVFKELERSPGRPGRVGSHLVILMQDLLQYKEPYLVLQDNFINDGRFTPRGLMSQKNCQELMMQIVVIRATAQLFHQAAGRLTPLLRERLAQENLMTGEISAFVQGFDQGFNEHKTLAEIELNFLNAAFDYIKVLHDYSGTFGVDQNGTFVFSVTAAADAFDAAAAKFDHAVRQEQAWIERHLQTMR